MATKVNMTIDQGTTFVTSFTLLDQTGVGIDFTTFTANSQMRKTYTSSNSYAFGVELNSSGEITLSMNAATTSSIAAGRYLYDIEVEDENGNRSRVVEGVVTITPQVTR